MDQVTEHIDVYMVCRGVTYPIGHGHIPRSADPAEQAGLVATFLHSIAWAYEEKGRRLAEDGPVQDPSETQPRVGITREGDRFYEVAPGEFVIGMSWDDAIESYVKHGNSATFEQVEQAFPNISWGRL